MHHLDEMQLDLGEKLEGLRRGQIALYHRVSASNQAQLDAIRAEVRQGRIEQGEMRISLDAIRRVLRHVQETGLPVANDEIRQSLADIHKAVNSDLGLRQQLELAIPVIPFLLEYKIGLEAGVDLGAIWKDLVERVRELGVM
jgi:predicted ATPase